MTNTYTSNRREKKIVKGGEDLSINDKIDLIDIFINIATILENSCILKLTQIM